MVVDKFLGELNAQTMERNVRVEASLEVKDWLAELGYKPEFGAREMNRVIHREVKLPLADFMLFGLLQDGGIARLDLEEHEGKKKITISAETAKLEDLEETSSDGEKDEDSDDRALELEKKE